MSPHLRYRLLCAALVVTCVGGWASSSRAVLQVYEGFDYTSGASILGQSGGGGWSNAWNKTGNAASTEIATAPGLSYAGLSVLGNKVTLTGQQAATGNGSSSFVARDLSTSFGAEGTTAWISFIGQRTGERSGTHGPDGADSYQRIFGLSFFADGTERFSIGELSSSDMAVDLDMWAVNNFVAGLTSPSAVPIDQQSFLLARVNYGVGEMSDDIYLWVNPNLALGEPSVGSAHATLLGQNLDFNRLRLSAGGSQSSTAQPNGGILAASGLIDEIRVGTTFASVIGPGLIPGDVNGDGVVDINDYNIIRDNFNLSGATRSQGDLNGDNLVNLIDFRIWKNHRTGSAGAGAGTPSELPGTVPEPSSAVLLLIAMLSIAFRRRGRR